MKKYISILAIAIAVCGFASCGGSDSSDDKSTNEKTDTTIVTRGGSASEGFGRCSQSGCYCKAFEGRGQTCRNCGHAYKKHY